MTGTSGEALTRTYPIFLSELKQRIAAARLRAALAVNRELVLLYWSIGLDILKKQKEEGWGSSVIDRLGADLRHEFPDSKGFSRRNFFYMRAFAEAFPDEPFVQQAAAKIPWFHNCIIIDKVKGRAEREWYIRQTFENGWSRNVLAVQIDSRLYERQGKAFTAPCRSRNPIAQQLTQESYAFDFLSITAPFRERKLQRALLENILGLILELGKGFAFVGSQHHLEISGKDFYLDLLFNHYRLHCFVVFELKTGEFKPEYAGKMNFYLSAVDDMLRSPEDNPSIGIILCRQRDKVFVEYALRDYNKPMDVAEFRVTPDLPKKLEADLPTAEELTTATGSKKKALR